MLFCVLNKLCKGTVNNKVLFDTLVNADINGEYYIFKDEGAASEFLSSYHADIRNSVNTKSGREHALNLLDNRSNIIYMTCVRIERISGYAFGFLVRNNDKYDFYMHTIPLEKNKVKAFQEAYLNLVSSIKIKKQIFILTNNEELIEEFGRAAKSSPPLKLYKTFYTEDFVNAYKTCPVIFMPITTNNILDFRILAALYKKVQLIYIQRIKKDPKINEGLAKVDDLLKTINKIPVVFTNTKLALINTYKQYHIEIPEEITIQEDNFKVKDIKVDTLTEASKNLSNELDKSIEEEDVNELDLLAEYAKTIEKE